MKDLLVLTRKFAPQNYIASIRPTKIVKYLKLDYNYSINVFFQKDISNVKDVAIEEDIKYAEVLHEISYSKLIIYLKNKYSLFAARYCVSFDEGLDSNKKRKTYDIVNRLKALARNLIYILDILEQLLYAKRVIRQIKKDKKKYDYYFSTTNLIEAYFVASYLKKKKHLIWILDLRDPILVDNYPCIAKKIYLHYILKAANMADFITGVSSPCIDYFPKKDKSKIIVIPNGYDTDDLVTIKNASYPINTKLVLSYTGALYNGKRDLRPFFKVLAQCAYKKTICLENVEIHYAGHDGALIRRQMEEYGVESLLIDHGYISRRQSLEIQLNSNALLLASWNNEGNTGIVTGKFYEYLMMKKNIICLISGNRKQSILKQMIDSAHCGYCYEEADNNTYEGLTIFMEQLYNSIVVHKKSYYFPNQSYIEQFSYRKIAAKFHSLLQ